MCGITALCGKEDGACSEGYGDTPCISIQHTVLYNKCVHTFWTIFNELCNVDVKITITVQPIHISYNVNNQMLI